MHQNSQNNFTNNNIVKLTLYNINLKQTIDANIYPKTITLLKENEEKIFLTSGWVKISQKYDLEKKKIS